MRETRRDGRSPAETFGAQRRSDSGRQDFMATLRPVFFSLRQIAVAIPPRRASSLDAVAIGECGNYRRGRMLQSGH